MLQELSILFKEQDAISLLFRIVQIYMCIILTQAKGWGHLDKDKQVPSSSVTPELIPLTGCTSAPDAVL